MLLPDAEVHFQMAQRRHSNWTRHETSEKRLHAHCPRCGEDDEHLLHVLICSADAAVDFRQPLLTDLNNWLIDDEDTHPDIADYLLTSLTSWFEDPFGTEPVILSTIPSIRHSTIAGNRLVRISLRFYSGTIGYLPTDILLFHSSRRCGERWAIRLIHRCWKILHVVWMYRNATLRDNNSRGATNLPSVITSEHS